MLEVNDLVAGYGRRIILRGIDIKVAPGEVVAVLGANGIGKTTLLGTIAGLLPVLGGTVRLAGANIEKMSPNKRVAAGLAFVPDGQQSFPSMSVLDNLKVAIEAKRSTLTEAERLDSVFTLFPKLVERRDQLAGTLSGGERQMLAIARALLSEPTVLMLDEPSHGLAPIIVEQLAEKISEIAESTSILLVEQNLTIPTVCATSVVVIEDSRVTMRGTPEDVLSSDHVVAAYLGTSSE